MAFGMQLKSCTPGRGEYGRVIFGTQLWATKLCALLASGIVVSLLWVLPRIGILGNQQAHAQRASTDHCGARLEPPTLRPAHDDCDV